MIVCGIREGRVGKGETIQTLRFFSINSNYCPDVHDEMAAVVPVSHAFKFLSRIVIGRGISQNRYKANNGPSSVER